MIHEGEYVDVPAHRIYVITTYTRMYFDFVNERGETCGEGEQVHRVIRKRDGKPFQMARFWPLNATTKGLMALEEV